MSSLLIFKVMKCVPQLTSLRRLATRESRNVADLRVGTVESRLWDIIISGGGLVGCSLACALGSSSILSGKNILLLESGNKTEYNIDSKKYSNRVCAINPGAKSLFESSKVWENMCNIRVKEIRKLQVWEMCSDARIAFQYPNMTSNIAYVIENDVMLKSFNARLTDLQDDVQVIRGVKAVDYQLPNCNSFHHENVVVELQDGQILKTKLLIGADGINSTIRKKMGVEYISWDYNQKGIVATLRLGEPTENIVAWQRFRPSGPVALLPLTDDLCSLVWTVSLPMCERLLKMIDEEFVDVLNHNLWDHRQSDPFVDSAVSGITTILSSLFPGKDNVRQLPPSILSVEPNSRAAFPLGLGHAAEYIAPRVALIGDAAHRVHPLAGQGVNLGFGDVKCLVDCLENSVFNGNDIGAMEPLLDYEVQRQRHVVPSVVAIDMLNRLYSTESMPHVLLRSVGLSFVNSTHWLKEKLMEHASC